MSRPTLLILIMLLPLALLAACGSGDGSPGQRGVPDPAGFKLGIEHPYFPTDSGRTWVLEGVYEGRRRREVVRALEQSREILGIACVAMRQEVAVEDVLVELTTEWFAQDLHDNVWKFGEETVEFLDGQFERSPDSWIAGEGDAVPWMALAAEPRVGDVYLGYRPGGWERSVVLSASEVAVVPAGTFVDCLQVLEDPEDPDDPDDPDDEDIILYAAGVGRVFEECAAGRVELVSIREGP